MHKPLSFKRHRFPADVIRQAVWLYFRFTLSLRDVEELLAQGGVEVSYETVRCWIVKFGPQIAARHCSRVLSDLPSFASASPRFAPKFAATSAPHCQFRQGGVSWSRRTRSRVVVVRGLGSAEGQAPARMKTRRRVFGGRPASECRLCGCRV